jgi:hypothetical protein
MLASPCDVKKHLHRLVISDDISVIMWHKKSPHFPMDNYRA